MFSQRPILRDLNSEGSRYPWGSGGPKKSHLLRLHWEISRETETRTGPYPPSLFNEDRTSECTCSKGRGPLSPQISKFYATKTDV